jgi:hypothetical protein
MSEVGLKGKKMLRRLRGWVAAAWSFGLWLMASPVLAAGGKPATKLVNVADTRMMEPGFNKWVADIYNSSHWQYGLLAVAIMAAMGLILGLSFDRLIGLLGIDLGKIEHHE